MSSINKKIIGATSTIYKNIKFKSVLECSCYKKLEASGLNFSYESERITLWEGIKLRNTSVYIGSSRKLLVPYTRALMNITYTPDFVIIKDNYKIYFDVKGKENDVYPIKKKMFLKYLETKNDGVNYMFFEPHNVGQILQSIEIIKNL